MHWYTEMLKYTAHHFRGWLQSTGDLLKFRDGRLLLNLLSCLFLLMVME